MNIRPFAWYGGKVVLSSKIIKLIDLSKMYIQPFVGGGAVFWGKPPSTSEILNDINNDLINLYKHLKRKDSNFENLVKCSLYSRGLYNEAKNILHRTDNLNTAERAWAYWFLILTSYLNIPGAVFNRNNNALKLRKSKVDYFCDKKYLIESGVIAKRLDKVCLEQDDALNIIKKYDNINAIFYLDPPYINTNCRPYDWFTENDYLNLLETIKNIKGRFILSSFENKLLQDFLNKGDFHIFEFDLRSASKLGNYMTNKIVSQARKKEMLITNFKLSSNNSFLI